MGKLIKTVTIDNDTQDIVEEVTDVIELSEMPWRKYLKMKNYNKDRYKMCEVCIAEQKRKYKGETPIICNGLRDYKTSLKAKFDENIIDSIVAELSEEEFDELQALFNPFDWFRVHMTDKSKAQDRWTQELALSCLDEDSPIAMSDGSYKKIKDVKVGDKVISYNEVKRTLPINKVLNVWDKGYKESYKITLENGDSVIATDDHPFLGYFKTGKENKLFGCNSYKTSYLSIKDGLKVGDNLYTVNKSPVWGSFDNLEVAKLLGYICTDGYINLKASKIQFRNIRKEYVDEFEKICLEQFQTKSTRKFKASYCDLKTKITRQDTWEVNITASKNLKDFLKSIGCVDKYTRETSIIDFVLNNFNEEACAAFINRVLSGDGCISKNKIQISISGKFESEFLEKLSRLFRKVGVRRSKVYHSETISGKRSALMITESLSAKSLLSFTGPIFGKEFQSNEQLKIADDNLQKWKTRRRVYGTTSRTKVISIQSVGKRHVYDIEVDKRHNFITNNIITHNCSAKNKAIRWGRRCIAEYEQVLMSDGTYKHIKDVKVNDKVLSFREDEAVSNTVLDVIDNGYKDIIYRVRLTSGRSVDLTSDHQILTKDGWKSIDEGLGIQDYVCENRSHSIDKKSLISRDEAKLLGYLLTDGYLPNKSNQTVKFTSCTWGYIKEVSDLCHSLFGFKVNIKKRSECNAWDIWLTDGNKGTRSVVKQWLQDLGLLGTKKKFRNSVQLLSSLEDEELGLFLNRVWAGDGCVSTWKRKDRPNGDSVELSLTSDDDFFIKTISNILFSRGIRNSIIWEKPRVSGNINSNGIYKLKISSVDAVTKFLNLTGPIKGKELKSNEALSELSKRDSHNQRPFKTDTDFKYTKIKSISKIESKTKVYDLTIENDHNFITNGIVTHNCGKSYAIIMELMYKIALAEKPLSILVAAPMVTMIDEISQVFVELSNLIDIPDFIQSKKSSPILEITFFNGSILKGITAADDGKSARGKKADVIWIDEVDFVPTKALDAIRAIQLDNPNVELIYTSTPIGEGNLFNFANQKITKEFHYPTFTRPDYTDEMHSSTEALSAIAYAQEILAIYGLDEAGVFPIRFIDMAYDYYIKDSYNEDFVLNNRDRFILIIGVDWNHDNNGTRIVVLGHDRVYSKFFIVEKQRISKIKMTQTLAVQTIVDLNRKYNCDHIICDEGFGIAQVSMLRLKGEEQYGKVPPNHPDIKLVDTVAVSFGSTLEITDPVKHQTIKKNTKQYIVENAQKVLENNQLALDDLKDDEVILQMKNYHIARTGLRGNIYKPKDKKIGDHDLDAFMLALYGFDMFYGAFIKPTLVEHGNILSKDVNYAAAGRTFGSEEYGSTLNTNLKFSRNNKRKSFKPRKRW